MRIEMRNTGDVTPYEHNPRVNDHAVVRSTQEYGDWEPIVLDANGVIVADHTSWKAEKASTLLLSRFSLGSLGELR